jgi:hypothetical protein
MTKYYIQFDCYCLVLVERPLWRVGYHNVQYVFTVHMLYSVLNVHTRLLLVQAQYSRPCPIFSNFRYNGSLVT